MYTTAEPLYMVYKTDEFQLATNKQTNAGHYIMSLADIITHRQTDLATQVDGVSVLVVEWKHDSVAGVNLLHHDVV